MSASRTVRTVILIVMDVLVLVAVLITARVIVQFFGSVASQAWAKSLVSVTDPIVHLSITQPVKTPYGGIFDLPAVIAVIAILAAEWILGAVRERA